MKRYSDEIKLFADCRCGLTESPIWHEKQKKLYWRDLEGRVYRKGMSDSADDYESFMPGIGIVGSIVLTDGDELMLFGEEGKVWSWIPGEKPLLYADFKRNCLFNDCLADPEGRVYCGMLTENYFGPGEPGKYGSLWILDTDGSISCLEDKIGPVPNGICFSPDLSTLYLMESSEWMMYSYDYDRKTGALSNRRERKLPVSADGIAMDVAGNLWSADCIGGMPAVCFNADFEIVKAYEFPSYRALSLAFGGCDKKTLFVATAADGPRVGEHDGSIFMIRTEHRGCDEYTMKTKGKETL